MELDNPLRRMKEDLYHSQDQEMKHKKKKMQKNAIMDSDEDELFGKKSDDKEQSDNKPIVSEDEEDLF
jgi:hypothetical protein